jgi:hypothetical protein
MSVPLDVSLDEQTAADGTALIDVVLTTAEGRRHVIYRGVDRPHVEEVVADLRAGRLDPIAVQQVFRDTVLARSGGPRSVYVRGMPLPMPFKTGQAGDRWAEAQRRIAALRAR